MKSSSSLRAVVAMALLAAAPLSHAVPIYSADFQGLKFTFEQTDADTLKFNIYGTPAGDWINVKYLGAFDLKDLGLNFSTDTAVANGPGAVNLKGLKSQLATSNTNCSKATGQTGSVCFDIAPDVSLGALPMDFTYIIDFSAPLEIAEAGPHLQIVFTNYVGGPKVGSLYSKNVPLTSSSGTVPEPSSGSLALLAVALLGLSLWMRRTKRQPSLA